MESHPPRGTLPQNSKKATKVLCSFLIGAKCKQKQFIKQIVHILRRNYRHHLPGGNAPRDMKKDKAVVIESPSTNEADENQDDAAESNAPARRFSTRNASSKYDFVKVYIVLLL